MSTNWYLGMRVLRGPDWDQDEDDGGDGHLGTLVGVKAEEGTAEVVWDNGQVTTCRVGKEGKHDLRIYDNAPAGDCMIRGLMCQGCKNSSIYGTSWRCSTCSNFHLCSRCYHLGAHPLSHHFLRRDNNAHEGVAVGTRSGASRIPTSGIFPEARVARGRDWEYGDVDGGPDSGGVVVEVVSPESGSARNAVRVSWDSGQSLQHRLGLHGKVDLVCTEEAPGPACYVSHLPVLAVSECVPGMQVTATPSRDEFKVEPKGEVKRDQDKTVLNVSSGLTEVSAKNATRASPTGTPSHSQVKQDDRQHFAPGALRANSQADVTSDSDCMVTTAEGRPDSEAEVRVGTEVRVDTEEEMRVGDWVEVGVDFDTFRDIQSQTASWTDSMAKCLGRKGVVKSVIITGEMEVDFEGHIWKISPICLKKTNKAANHSAVSERREIKRGDKVRIISDLGLLQEAQKGHGGWVNDMARAGGKVGRIKAINPAGNPVVFFGQQHWIFNPDSCIPAPGSATDFLYKGDADGDLGGLMQGLHKEIGNLLDENTSSAQGGMSGGDQGRIKLAALFDAVASGDTNKTAILLDSDAGLARETIGGATALDYAVHCRQEAAVRLLVAKGAEIDRGDNKENTPLLRAIYTRNCALTRTLVELGADVNLSNEDGQTPLHLAVDVDYPDVISLLLQHGASINRRNLQGDTPLCQALEKGDQDSPVVEAILSAEFLDLGIRRKNGQNALHATALYERPRCDF